MRFIRSLLCAGALLYAAAAPAQPSAGIAQLAWLEGTWVQGGSGGDLVQESWLGPQGNTMAAVNLTQSARRGTSFEFLRIVESAGSLSYWASPEGRAPVEFRLKEVGAQRVVFENAAHAFPQRILYWRDADGSLKARIEGSVQGRERSMEWRFEPAARPASQRGAGAER